MAREHTVWMGLAMVRELTGISIRQHRHSCS